MNKPSYRQRAAAERAAAQIFRRKAETAQDLGYTTAAQIFRSLEGSSWKASGDLDRLADIFGEVRV